MATGEGGHSAEMRARRPERQEDQERSVSPKPERALCEGSSVQRE